jgi:hypothetical protein
MARLVGQSWYGLDRHGHGTAGFGGVSERQGGMTWDVETRQEGSRVVVWADLASLDEVSRLVLARGGAPRGVGRVWTDTTGLDEVSRWASRWADQDGCVLSGGWGHDVARGRLVGSSREGVRGPVTARRPGGDWHMATRTGAWRHVALTRGGEAGSVVPSRCGRVGSGRKVGGSRRGLERCG